MADSPEENPPPAELGDDSAGQDPLRPPPAGVLAERAAVLARAIERVRTGYYERKSGPAPDDDIGDSTF